MDERETAIRNVSEAMSVVCRQYYRTNYDSKFRAATKVTRSIPVEACNEIRNTFDHFTRAFEISYKISTSPKSSRLEISKRQERAMYQIERGRRHLYAAAFYCDTHLIAFRIETIPNMVRSLETRDPKPNINFADVWKRFAGIKNREERLPTPPLRRRGSLRDIMHDIKEIEQLTKRAMRLANDCDRLYEDLTRHFSKRNLRRIIRRPLMPVSPILFASNKRPK